MPTIHTVPDLDLGSSHDAGRPSVGQLAELVEVVWCPIHGRRAANIRCEPGSDETFEVVFRPCCDALQAAIQRTLARVSQ